MNDIQMKVHLPTHDEGCQGYLLLSKGSWSSGNTIRGYKPTSVDSRKVVKVIGGEHLVVRTVLGLPTRNRRGEGRHGDGPKTRQRELGGRSVVVSDC